MNSGLAHSKAHILHKAILPSQEMLDKCIAIIQATVLITQKREGFILRKKLGRALEVHGLEQ